MYCFYIWRGTPGLGITYGNCSIRGEPRTDPHIVFLWKRGPRPSRCEFRAQNSQREGRGPLFQRDIGISVGFFTETTGSLRDPDTLRTPSYVGVSILESYV